jgi:drug/metabolite transporter (DMT)-like permease
MIIPVVLLALRILGMGLERPLVKRLGIGYSGFSTTVVFVGTGQLIFAAILLVQWLLNPHCFDNLLTWLPLALIPALCYGVSYNAYCQALSEGEVSLLTPLYASGLVLIFFIELAMGLTTFSMQALLGILLVALGVAIFNIEAGKLRHALNPLHLLRLPGARWMLLCAACIGTGRSIDKLLAPDAPEFQYAFVTNFFPVVFGLIMLAYRGNTGQVIRQFTQRWKLALAVSIAGHGALVALFYSLDYVAASVAEPVTQLSVFVSILFGGLWFGENIRARWLPSVLIVVGVVLLAGPAMLSLR